MATESVDNLDKLIGDIFDYMIARVEMRHPLDSEAIFPIYGKEVFDHTKAALQAYYTHECARKVLEELEALKLNTGWTADDYRAVLNERIAHFRAAIQEVGGGE